MTYDLIRAREVLEAQLESLKTQRTQAMEAASSAREEMNEQLLIAESAEVLSAAIEQAIEQIDSDLPDPPEDYEGAEPGESEDDYDAFETTREAPKDPGRTFQAPWPFDANGVDLMDGTPEEPEA